MAAEKNGDYRTPWWSRRPVHNQARVHKAQGSLSAQCSSRNPRFSTQLKSPLSYCPPPCPIPASPLHNSWELPALGATGSLALSPPSMANSRSHLLFSCLPHFPSKGVCSTRPVFQKYSPTPPGWQFISPAAPLFTLSPPKPSIWMVSSMFYFILIYIFLTLQKEKSITH